MTIFHNIREGFPLPLTPSHSSKLLADSQGRENKIDTSTAEFRLPYEYFLQKFTSAFRWPRHPLIVTGQPQGSFAQQTTPPNLFDITLVGLDRKTVPLRDFFNQGKIVVIVFWATWCHPCLLEIPELNRLIKTYPDQLEVVAISVDQSIETCKQGMRNMTSPGYPVYIDFTKKLFPQFIASLGLSEGQRGVPLTLIYTADGSLLFSHSEYRSGLIPGKVQEYLARSPGEQTQ